MFISFNENSLTESLVTSINLRALGLMLVHIFLCQHHVSTLKRGSTISASHAGFQPGKCGTTARDEISQQWFLRSWAYFGGDFRVWDLVLDVNVC